MNVIRYPQGTGHAMPKAQMRQFNFRLAADIHEGLQTVAEAEETNMADLAREALAQVVKRRLPKARETLAKRYADRAKAMQETG